MEAFELKVDDKNYKVVKTTGGNSTYNVFNHSSFHTIVKINSGYWEVIEHRFGNHQIPVQQIGLSIDEYLGL
ncbi:hypothetical protein [Mucilaginibacter dorajii]|uniref:Uncharacterized protein n=1 Tax=Mucilaginibacter dorajii TaxID=692994 RepID=A0ABP7R9S6_9SPHI|nr:hypothetical protein [Mucilaginibacter dorajii]MCS3736780.1 hypothetical protein [Mucilaginibacter dorajii]